MSLLFSILTVQVVLGAFDNLWHHEIKERLPAKKSASGEIGLHAAREFLYALIFFGLAWYEWRGVWATLVATVFLAEIVITLSDFIVEDRTRRLPALERVLHTVLAIMIGAALAVLAPILWTWWQLPTAVVTVDYGAFSWMFTGFSAGVFAWSLRDAMAALRHRTPPEWVRNPIARASKPSGRYVLISGATGFIGGHLVRSLVERGDVVTVLTRNPDRALDRFGPHVQIVTTLDAIASDTLVHAIVNLAGARILGLPWTRARRRVLKESRLGITRALVNLCARLDRPPQVFVSASAIGYYGVHESRPLAEDAGPQDIFQSQLCQEWEAAAAAAESTCPRVVRLRFGLVFGADGGALPSLALPVRLGLGAILGTAKQWVSWIHIDDLIRLIEFAMEKPVRGAMNAVSPNPVTHLQVQNALAHSLRRPVWLRVPAWVPRLALGEMAQLLVDGQRVIPRRALTAGFTFKHPDLRETFDHLLRPNESPAELTEIYYNGDCPVCRAEMTHYARLWRDAPSQLRFVDATRNPEALMPCALSAQHLERRVYLRRAQGPMLSGMPAIIELWRRMPGYRWLAQLSSLPVIRPLVASFYDLLLAPGLAAWARIRRTGTTSGR